MKFKKIYIFPLAVLAVIFILSNSAGPGINPAQREVTGAPGSGGDAGTCGNQGCHNSGAFNPTVTIELLNGTTVVDKYVPGSSYTLRIVNTPGSGSPARFGFQAVALDASDNQAGAWQDVGAANHTVELSGRSYVEHSAPSLSGTFELGWKAPAAGTGEVTFYAASNAVNANGGPTGDGTASSTLSVGEGTASATIDPDRQLAYMEVMPNPVGEQLTVEVSSRISGGFTLRVVDVSGAVVKTGKMDLTTGLNRAQFDVATLPAGLYILQLYGSQHVAATQMLKK